MNLDKLKNKIRIFFSWKQTKKEINSFLTKPIDVLKECPVSPNQITEFEKKWKIHSKLLEMLMIKFFIILCIWAIILFIQDNYMFIW